MDHLSPLIAGLHNEGRLRVWSLVVTVFGDAVQQRGGRIATLRLQHLLERVGIEAGTLRTALSRLSSDGWVLRDREGRNSFYRLSDSAKAEITAATVDIYAPRATADTREWVMASGDFPPDGGIKIAANTWLFPAGDLPDLSNYIRVSGTLADFPKAARERIVSEAHRDALAALSNDIDALKGVDFPPLDAMAARMLLIHRWRRVVLRFADIPPELRASNAILLNPRQAVADAYHQLSKQSENWLDSGTDAMAPMPASDQSFKQRFGK